LVTVVLALALVAAACGGDDNESTPTTTATTVAEQTTTTASGGGATTPTTLAPTTTQAPPPGPQPFIMAVPGIPGTLMPNSYQAALSNHTYPVFSSSLVRYKRLDDQTTLQGPEDVEGEIAESWVENPDGSITFTLRDAVSPFGNTVTSADVKWSFDRMKEFDPITRFLFMVGSFDQDNLITVVDDKTFTVNVTQPNVLTLRTLNWYGTIILDSTEALSHATADDPWANEWLAVNTASYGPYFITEDDYVAGESIRAKANPNYFRGVPFFDEVILKAIPESTNRLQVLETGDINYAEALSLSEFASLENSGAAQAIRAPIANFDIIYLNFAFEPFADVRVREAISMALDRDALLAAAYQGVGLPAVSFLDSDLPGPKVPPAEEFTFDPEAAKALLAQTAWPDGFAFELVANNGRPGPQAEPLAVLIKDQLGAIGIDVTVNVVAASADFNAGRSKKDGNPPAFQAWLDTATPIVPDVAYFSALTYASGPLAINNRMGYANDKVDELTVDALGLPNGAERDARLLELARELQDTYPLIPLVETVRTVSLGNSITGYYVIATNRLYPHLFAAE
jgi:peptide/nickel transport system substrate-binding protein